MIVFASISYYNLQLSTIICVYRYDRWVREQIEACATFNFCLLTCFSLRIYQIQVQYAVLCYILSSMRVMYVYARYTSIQPLCVALETTG